jgi:hypothetical protein
MNIYRSKTNIIIPKNNNKSVGLPALGQTLNVIPSNIFKEVID